MSLPAVPNMPSAWSDEDQSKAIRSLYEYLGRLKQAIDTGNRAIPLSTAYLKGDGTGGFATQAPPLPRADIASGTPAAGKYPDGGSDPAAWTALPTQPTVQVFTSNGTWNRPTGCKAVIVEVIGAGGGSGGCAATGVGEASASGGGGAGGYAFKRLDVASISSSTITVGAGGSAATAGQNAGGAGGTSSWADGTNTISATGGSGGGGGNANANVRTTGLGADGGVGSGGTVNTQGGGSMFGLCWPSLSSARGGLGGASVRAGGPIGSTEGVGTAGLAPGGGASGSASLASASARAGAAGAAGAVIVTEFY